MKETCADSGLTVPLGKRVPSLLVISSPFLCAQSNKLPDDDISLETQFEVLLAAAKQESPEFGYHVYKFFEKNELALEKYRIEAMVNLSAAAESGHLESMYELGRSLLEGSDRGKDIEKAIHWLGRASDQGHADAAYVAGRAHYVAYANAESDDGHSKHFEESARYLGQVICSEGSDDRLMVLAIGTYGQLLLSKNFADDVGWSAQVWTGTALCGAPRSARQSCIALLGVGPRVPGGFERAR